MIVYSLLFETKIFIEINIRKHGNFIVPKKLHPLYFILFERRKIKFYVYDDRKVNILISFIKELKSIDPNELICNEIILRFYDYLVKKNFIKCEIGIFYLEKYIFTNCYKM